MEVITLMFILNLLGMQFPDVRASVMHILLHLRNISCPSSQDMGTMLHTPACVVADRQKYTAWGGPWT